MNLGNTINQYDKLLPHAHTMTEKEWRILLKSPLISRYDFVELIKLKLKLNHSNMRI